ncbi:NADP-specific glutamate dehydrogenase [Fusarium oxysporum f. sp. albedinis]|nr:NADP-specific glutamate dehydrogenase [Fusarium oxysporum f. sp. albedinis]
MRQIVRSTSFLTYFSTLASLPLPLQLIPGTPCIGILDRLLTTTIIIPTASPFQRSLATLKCTRLYRY